MVRTFTCSTYPPLFFRRFVYRRKDKWPDRLRAPDNNHHCDPNNHAQYSKYQQGKRGDTEVARPDPSSEE